ncbi:sugar phosphate isomerase/epimerase [Paenibacillus sp. TRM 82003]|nr:sugar phosphate isomerase/epimerase [Paenibacillus sp. TRM 82003]
MQKGIHDIPFLGIWEAEAFFAQAKQAGFEGVELNVLEDGGYLSPSSTNDELKRLRNLSRDYDMPIHSLSTNLHNVYALSSDDALIRNRGESLALKLIEFAGILGASIVQIVPGTVSREACYEKAYRLSQESLRGLGIAAQSANVTLGVENVCNHFLASPKEFGAFLDEIDQPSIQAYLDIGNAMATGFTEHWVSLIGDRIVNIHAKDYRISSREFLSPLSGDVHWPHIISSLRSLDYEGFFITTPQKYAYCAERLMNSCSSDLSAILRLEEAEPVAGGSLI